MPHEIIFQFIISLGIRALLAALIVAGVMRYYEKSMSFQQSYLIALIACAVSLAIYVAYQLARGDLGVPTGLDGLLAIPLMVLTAAIITRLAANYGVKKTSGFGLGAKVIVTIYAVLGVIGVIVALLMALYGQ